MTGFSLPQQIKYRGLVARAWQAAAKRTGAPAKDAKMRDAWTRSILHGVTGVWSTTEVDARKYYAAVMAAFEREVGDSIYWQLRAEGGNDAEQARRLLHKIRALVAKHELTEAFCRGVLRQALAVGDGPTPQLGDLPPAKLLKVLDGLKAAAKRMEVEA